MISFLICVALLILGYVFYGRLVERLFGTDPKRPTPAMYKPDGMDCVPMPTWKVFMIQFLNIAGTGPVFGSIMGAKFGSSCYLWIVFGSIFAGAVHDYISGMMSIRSGGLGVPNLVGHFLGNGTRKSMLIFSVFFMILVGAVFVYSPAIILGGMTNFFGDESKSALLWGGIIFVYYVVATLVPIHKLIGKIYPVFAGAILFMAVLLGIRLFSIWPSIPELWDGFQNKTTTFGIQNQSIFPCLFITIACGAISGFHATQCPMMARCIKNEKLGRPVFYGAMIVEGVVALIWAAIASWFFYDGGMESIGIPANTQAPEIVIAIAKSWLGTVGSVLALLGVVAAPITTGDTALRSARLMVADFFHIDQKPLIKRLYIAIPIFIGVSLILWFNIADSDGFNKVWRYFGLANQSLAVFILWTETSFFSQTFHDHRYLITMIPACFVTSVCVTYFFVDPTCLALPQSFTIWIALAVWTICLTAFYLIRKYNPNKKITV